MADNKINVGGRLHSIATGNVLTGANEIFDDDKNKKQSDINTETYALVNEVNAKLDTLSPEQQSALAVATKANKNEANLGYYVCETEANVAAKVVSNATGYVLSAGGSIKIKMNNANAADNATLNINSTGARPLYYDGERASITNTWESGEIVEVYYDGTNFYANNVEGCGKFASGEKVKNVAIDSEPTINSNNLVKSGGVQNELALGAVYDVSAKNPTAGPNNDGKWESLSALLSDANLNTLIPTAVRKGGMSIKFVQSSDNKYVQYRLMHTLDNASTAAADFVNVANWQGVDETPSVGSKNLIESGAVWGFNNMLYEAVAITTDLTTAGNDGEYLLYSSGITSNNNRIYKRVNGSWARVDNANPAVIPDKPMIWRITSTNRFYYKQGMAVAVPYVPLDQYLYDYFKKSFIVDAIAIAPEAPSNDIGSDGDYYLRQAPSNHISYHKENGSWVNASNAIYAAYGMDVIWKVDNRLYFRQGYLGSYPFIAFDDFAASLATTIRDGQVKFYNLHAANNGVAFADKYAARQFWGVNYGYRKPLGTVLFYTLTDGTVVFEQNIDKRDAPGSVNYYNDKYYTNVLNGNPSVGIGKQQVNVLDGINRNNNPNTVINGSLYTKIQNKTFTLMFNIQRAATFVFCPTIYSDAAGDLEIELYNVSDSSILYKSHSALRGTEVKTKVVCTIPPLSVSPSEIRLTVKTTTDAISTLCIKDDSAYFSMLEYTPSLLESFDSNDIEDAVDGMGREILCRVENYKHATNKNTYRTPVGNGGKYYVTLQKTEASNFKIYAIQDDPVNVGNVVVSFPSTEDWNWTGGKTFSFNLPKLGEGHEWYISFRNNVANITWQKLIVEKAVPKSALSNWANKTIAVYGDSIAAITNINNGDGPTWQVTSNYDWGQRIAHYFHLKSIYGRGIGSQTYKYRGNGGALCWVDTATGAYKGRLNIYNYDDYLNPETQATVVAAAVESGYDSQTMTFCRGSLSSWDRITKMFPAAIKDSIDAIIVMSVNDDYDDTVNKTWEDFAFVENSAVDPEWAASDYYATYGGDYNNTLQGGIASTIMKLQTWMPQAKIILCMSGAGDRYNDNVALTGKEFTKYDSFVKMHRLLGCPLIDIFGTAGINGLNHETYCADQGIHPYTTAGGRAYAAAVIGGMKGILTLKDVY